MKFQFPDILSLNASPIFQSQPCHWRNAKNVVKRSVPEMIGGPSTPATSLSENVNLFQSLRVLQEGEADTELFQNSTSISRSGKTDIYVKNNFTVRTIKSNSIFIMFHSVESAPLLYNNCVTI